MTQGRRIEVEGVGLWVAEAGSPQAPPLLLLHGWPDSSRGWAPVLPHLADRFRLLIPDQRGFGRSDMPEGRGAYRMGTLLGDVLAILDACEVKRTAVAGHDLGGALTWALGALVPQRLTRAVVLAAPHPVLMHEVGAANLGQLSRAFYVWLLHAGEAGERLLAADGFRFLSEFAFGSSEAIDAEARAAYRLEWSQPGRFHAMGEWYRANYTPDLFNPDRELELAPVRVPVRYVHGGRDWAFVPELATGSGRFVDADYDEVLLSDCSHWMMYERPAEVAELITGWVAGS